MEEKGRTEIGKGLMLASLFYIAGVLVSFFATNQRAGRALCPWSLA